jgi:LuxR family maltose regulon positive regulatory protein
VRAVSCDAPLLATKLLVPPAPEWLLARPRLLDLLSEGVQGPVTLVTAPAGAGKTLLLASWVAAGRLPGPVVWLSLDADDNDPSRLWTDVLAGLRAGGGSPPDGLLATLAPPGPGTAEAFLALLINGLGELPDPVVVVLDDLHELTDAQVLFGVEFLMRHAPSQLRLVLATRTDPALPVARLRVAGAVTELHAADLAFTQTEAGELLAGHGVTLSDADLGALWARTEGWAAGLRLAAQSLNHHADPSGFVAAFSGDHRTVADYLLEEVLARRPAEVRDFLLRTSVADRLTGALADALTGGQDGARRLVELERTNGFVLPLDPHRTTYRYHRLFAELLRAQLHFRYPGQVPELHRKAAYWLATNGETVDAIRHAVAAEDWELARGLLVERWPAMTGVSVLTIRDLLARLPPDLVRGDAELAYIAAGSRITLGDLDGADTFLQLAEANASSVP